MRKKIKVLSLILVCTFPALVSGCGPKRGIYFNEMMDFAAIQTVAVMPFQNLTDEEDAAERVRDVFMNMLLATEAVYVLPPGEVHRAITRVGMIDPATPSIEEIQRLAAILENEVVITGTLREYEILRAGPTTSNIISLSLQMIETQAGTIIWSSSCTKGGVTVMDRLFGSGGEPMNEITLECVDELLDELFQ